MAWLTKIFNFVAGARYSANPEPLTEGQSGPLLSDPLGRLVVALGAPLIGSRAVQLTAAKKGALKAGAGTLVEVGAWNRGSAAVWFQLFNKATAAVDGDVPVTQFFLPAGSTIGWRPTGVLFCALGIHWAASSTPGVLTTIATDEVGHESGVI